MANNDSALYVLRYNEISAALEAQSGLNWVSISTGSAEPAGADEQIQFNENGEFGASADLTWSEADSELLSPAVRTDAISSDTLVSFNQETDFKNNPMRNTVILPINTDPASPSEGQIWYDNINHVWRGFDGTDKGTFDFTPDA